MQVNAKAALDDHLQVDPPPAHDPIHRRVRPVLDDPRQLGQLLQREPWRGPRMGPVVQPGETLSVVAVYPIAQGLPVHPSVPRRILARMPLEHQRQGKHAPRRLGVTATLRLPPQSARIQLQTRQHHRHRTLLDPKSGSQP